MLTTCVLLIAQAAVQPAPRPALGASRPADIAFNVQMIGSLLKRSKPAGAR
jgi:hypothetical protein